MHLRGLHAAALALLIIFNRSIAGSAETERDRSYRRPIVIAVVTSHFLGRQVIEHRLESGIMHLLYRSYGSFNTREKPCRIGDVSLDCM